MSYEVELSQEDMKKYAELLETISAHVELDNDRVREIGEPEIATEEQLREANGMFLRMTNLVCEWVPLYVKFLMAKVPTEMDSDQLKSSWAGSMNEISQHITGLVNFAKFHHP